MTAPATPDTGASAPPGPPPTVTHPQRATFQNVTTKQSPRITVHFNPLSLQISLSNTIDNSSKQDKAQYVSKSSSKLTMDLIFDTSDKGTDVREDTGKIAAFMNPHGADQAHQAPPTVLFEWGTFTFRGIFESYRETVDFFSHDGVPLRASINLTMSAQTLVFSSDKAQAKSKAVNVPPTAGNASQVASNAGNENAGRDVAAANGLESMRFSKGPLTVDASVKLAGPVAFASAGAGIGVGGGIGISGGAGIGISGGAGIGISGGSGIGISGGAGFSASAGFSSGAGGVAGLSAGGGVAGFGTGGVAGFSGAVGSIGFTGGVVSASGVVITGPAFGGSASAGVPATMGAFAGLRVSSQVPGPALDPMRLLPRAQPQVVAVGPQASFGIGGQAIATGSASLGTDVGSGVSAQARLSFDGG